MSSSTQGAVVQNTGRTEITGTLSLVIDPGSRVTLANRTGTTQTGKPFITAKVQRLRPGAKLTVPLRFRRAGSAPLRWSARLFSGRVLH